MTATKDNNTDPVAALFVRADSIYKTLPGVDCYDEFRDARTWPGGCPVIAHSPCRGWGCLRAMSHATEDEKALGRWAAGEVRSWGGVLEHPQGSTLWKVVGLPRPGAGRDEYGGFTLTVDQFWWGHRARKRTWLYVCGCEPGDVPAMPIKLGTAPCVVTNTHGLRTGMPGYRREITKRERDATPPDLARWLVEAARGCSKHNSQTCLKGATKNLDSPENNS